MIDPIHEDAASASESPTTLGLASEPIGDPFGRATSNLDLTSLDYAPIEPVRVARGDGIKVGDSYTLLRLGAFDPAGDTRDLDTGYWAEIAFGRCIAHFFSIEAVTGFYRLTGDSGAEVYGMALMFNGRVGIPIAIVEPYGPRARCRR